jgi:hypothetical protein
MGLVVCERNIRAAIYSGEWLSNMTGLFGVSDSHADSCHRFVGPIGWLMILGMYAKFLLMALILESTNGGHFGAAGSLTNSRGPD